TRHDAPPFGHWPLGSFTMHYEWLSIFLGPIARPRRRDSEQLKPLKAIELLLDALLVAARRAPPHPGPLLDGELAGATVRLEVDGGHHLIADQHRQREVAKEALLLRQVGFEAMFVVEKQRKALALNDERIKGGENVHPLLSRLGLHREVCGSGPMLELAGRLDGNWHQFPAPHALFDEPPQRWLALGVLMADGFDTDEPLRAQPALEQIVDELALRGRPGPLLPTE